MKKLLFELKTPFLITIVFIVICGLFYPLLMTGLGQAIFPSQSNGSLIKVDGKVVGSSLIGQKFTDVRFMKARPSAVNYNTYTIADKANGIYTSVATGSANLSPSNPALKVRVESDLKTFLKANPTVSLKAIPDDLLTASGSGLDPQISPTSAEIQVPALSEATGLSKADLNKMIQKNTQQKLFGFIGENTVNVLGVNIDIAKALGLN